MGVTQKKKPSLQESVDTVYDRSDELLNAHEVQITFPAVSTEASLRDLNAGTAHEPVSEDNHLSENITHVLV
jgi:hypothetical protein